MTLMVFYKHIFLYFKCMYLFIIIYSFACHHYNSSRQAFPNSPTTHRLLSLRCSLFTVCVFLHIYFCCNIQADAFGDYNSSASSPLAGFVLTPRDSTSPTPSFRNQRLMWPKIWRRCALWPSCAKQRCWRTCGQGPC